MLQTGAKTDSKMKFEGVNYQPHMDVKDISKAVKDEMKRLFPSAKLSSRIQRYAGGETIWFYLLAWDREVFADTKDIDFDLEAMRSSIPTTAEDLRNHFEYYKSGRSTYTINEYYINENLYLSQDGKNFFNKLTSLVSSFNYDDSDLYTDYYHVNFYTHYQIGKWDKPFQKTNR